MPPKKIGASPAQARLIVEMNRGSLVVLGDHACRWYKGVGNARAGKPRRATVLACMRLGWVEEKDSVMHLHGITVAGTAVAAEIAVNEDAIMHRKSRLKMTPHFIAQALAKRHPFPQWIVAEEVRLDDEDRTVDLLAMSKKVVVAYEIKVSRSDFLSELDTPDKRRPAFDWFSQFYFAVPTGLVKVEEVPTACGLIEIFHNKKFMETKAAMNMHLHEPDWPLVVQIGRSIVRSK